QEDNKPKAKPTRKIEAGNKNKRKIPNIPVQQSKKLKGQREAAAQREVIQVSSESDSKDEMEIDSNNDNNNDSESDDTNPDWVVLLARYRYTKAGYRTLVFNARNALDDMTDIASAFLAPIASAICKMHMNNWKMAPPATTAASYKWNGYNIFQASDSFTP